MAYASKAGRAFTNPSNPQAQGVCDRCGIWTQRYKLRNQFAWRGSALMPTYIFVCSDCYDTPNEQLRAIVLSPDPVPIEQPRTESFFSDEQSGGCWPIGNPSALDANAVMPQFGRVKYGVPLSLISVTSIGSNIISVTCSAPHGLQTNAQVSVLGLNDPNACGFFSVTVTSAMALTYQTFLPIIPGGLLTPATVIKTALVGLPRGLAQIPQIGPALCSLQIYAAPQTMLRVGIFTTFQLIAYKGVPPYTFSVPPAEVFWESADGHVVFWADESGNLVIWDGVSSFPPGLSIDPATGIVSGVPTTPGTYPLIFTVTDSAGNVAATNPIYFVVS
jgi:Putative Ig domain